MVPTVAVVVVVMACLLEVLGRLFRPHVSSMAYCGRECKS
jgi:hypothetical protein